jgi:hypothetical protein
MTDIQLQQLVERLLYEEESETLDFKEEQYPFVKATATKKGEVLKDILTFANAWRRNDAYILIGVREVKGGKSTVVGVSKHLEDASLQQFVNSKTQRPVRFSYQVCKCEGKSVGVLSIPVQDRPVFLKRDYESLKCNVVYVRRGTSTAEADPDEIAKMKEFDSAMLKPSPLLELFFFDNETGECGGRELNISTDILHFPERDKIPDYGTREPFGISGIFDNRDYYRELAEYLSLSFRIAPVGFAVKNVGKAVASNVRLELQVDDVDKDYLFLHSLPNEPSKGRMPIVPSLSSHFSAKDPGVTIERYAKSWLIQVRIGNVQPGQIAKDDCALYFGSPRSCVLKFDGVIFSDEIPEPIRFPMSIAVDATEKHVDIETFLKNIQTD